MQARCISELSERQVHIWTLSTSAENDVVAKCERVLTSDETGRAAQFRFSGDRESFILTRGVLRHLLGCYLGLHPGSIQFEYSSNGKAALASDSGLQFNVAHSRQMAAIAVTAGCDVGIDLEQMRTLPDLGQIAARFFCTEEAAEIDSLPEGERARAFFTCWTRKEAYIKATAEGLSRPLNSFRVMKQPGEPGNLVLQDHEATVSESWTLHDLHLAPDYAAAIAYRDRPRPLSIFPAIDLAQLIDIS
jgi:4'-phosphopantetheinyl transferase